MNEAMVEAINEREPAFLARDGKGKGYVCPQCGSGSGPKGTGLHRDPGAPTHWKCFVCGGYFDVLDLYGLAFGLETFPEKLAGAAAYYGLTVSAPRRMTKRPAARPAAPEPDCTAFFKAAQARLAQTDYPQRRGLSAATCARFHLGYDPAWRNPKAPETVPPSPRLIIPTGRTSYLARDVRGKDELSEQEARYTKVKVGKTRLFNAEALDTAEKPVFIVEGEIDAMSIVEAGGEAVGLGSASNVRLLLERLAEKKPAQPLILALDNDERGRKASCELEDGLRAASLPYFVYNPCGDCKDANEALQMAPESFLRRVGDGERLPEIERLTYLQTSAQGHLQAFVDGIAESVNTPCLPTGFDALDRALDGGLYEGLYIVGAISSLGKTTLVTQIGDQIASGGQDVLVFSLEMARAELMKDSPIPKGMTKADYAEMKFSSALVEEDDFDMLVMGRTQGKGCYCYVNGVLKSQMDKYYGNYKYMVIDNEAGLEHVSRGILPHVDTLLLISDCSRRGVQAAARIAEMVDELQLKPGAMKLIVNRAPGGQLNASVLEEIEKHGLDLVGVLPQDETVYEYDCEGKPSAKVPEDNPVKAALSSIMAKLGL